MDALKITNILDIPLAEIDFEAVRAQGAGGQNVNKVSSAIHCRFDIHASSLPSYYRERLLNLKDKRITKEGVIVIKAQSFRRQEQNKADALKRLQELLQSVTRVPKTRVPTKPSRSSTNKRLNSKTQKGKTKSLRGKVGFND